MQPEIGLPRPGTHLALVSLCLLARDSCQRLIILVIAADRATKQLPRVPNVPPKLPELGVCDCKGSVLPTDGVPK